jgi:hypothetical protein
VIPAGEAGGATDAADHGAGDDGARPEEPGERRARRPDRHGQFLPGVAQRGAGAAQVIEERRGEFAAGGISTAPDGVIDPRIRAA